MIEATMAGAVTPRDISRMKDRSTLTKSSGKSRRYDSDE
jgi:hypothetical protein